MNSFKEKMWKACIDFHGHKCPGLAIGYKVALYAIELLDIEFSVDEDVVCIAENDACGIDALQVILGCTAGKGNLFFHITGKSAYTFFHRSSGRSVRIVQNTHSEMDRETYFRYLMDNDPSNLFHVTETRLNLPEKAPHFDSYICDCCGESAGSKWIRLREGKKYCLDCYQDFDRFHI